MVPHGLRTMDDISAESDVFCYISMYINTYKYTQTQTHSYHQPHALYSSKPTLTDPRCFAKSHFSPDPPEDTHTLEDWKPS